MKSVHVISIICLASIGLIISICKPTLFSQDKFLNEFVAQQLIPVTTVLVTVSLVNVLKLLLEYTRVERTFGVKVFDKARRRVTQAAIELLLLICFSVIVAFLNSLIQMQTIKSAINFLSIIILVECLFVMFELIRTAILLAEEEPITQPKAEPTANAKKSSPSNDE